VAIALISSVNGGTKDTGTSSAIDTTSATLITFGVIDYAGDPAAVVSDSKGNTWTPITTQTSANCREIIYYCASPTVGTGHTFTLTNGNIFASYSVDSWSGTDPSSPLDVSNGNTSSGGTTTLSTGSVTPSASGALVLTFCGQNGGGSDTVTTPFDATLSGVAYNSGNYLGNGRAYEIQTIATARNPTWSGASTDRAATIAVFLAAGGAPPPSAYVFGAKIFTGAGGGGARGFTGL
jgi:hypothetical protein